VVNKLLAESVTCTMSANGCIPRADSGSIRKGAKRYRFLFGEVGLAEDLTISGLHFVESIGDAVADGSLGGFGPGWRIMLWRQRLKEPVFHSATAVVIDDGVTQDSEEPGGGRAVFAERRSLPDGADVGRLKKVFGGCTVMHSSLNELQETLALIDQAGDGLRGRHHSTYWMRGQYEGINRSTQDRADQK
jgi:hypothetical protein